MKRFLLLLLSLCLSAVSFAQFETVVPKNHPAKDSTGYMPFFPDNTISFSVAYMPTMKKNDPHYLFAESRSFTSNASDTAIYNNTKYRIFDYRLLVREDTVSGKIFRYYPEFDAEVMTCDMSLLEGDTFMLPSVEGYPNSHLYYYWELQQQYLIVDSVTYVNGRKVIWFPPIQESAFFSARERNYPLCFIEGIGPSYGPFGRIEGITHEDWLDLLLCVHYSDSLQYMTDSVLGCEQFVSMVPEYPESVVHLYPNPANQLLNVEFDDMENPQGVITVMDMAGVVALAQECNSTVTQIDVSLLKSGIYVVCFRNEKGHIVQKFVKF